MEELPDEQESSASSEDVFPKERSSVAVDQLDLDKLKQGKTLEEMYRNSLIRPSTFKPSTEFSDPSWPRDSNVFQMADSLMEQSSSSDTNETFT